LFFSGVKLINKYSVISLVIIGCLFLGPAGAPADTCDGDWSLVMNKNGIKAYSRKVEGSGIFEFRAVMVVDARAEVVAEALRDTPAMTEWLPDCEGAYVINMEDRNKFTSYVSLDLPWPVKDRDMVLDTVTTYDLVHARAITDFVVCQEPSMPPKDTHVRIPALKGQYVFEFVTRERTGIVHTYRGDIGGSVPEWLANHASKYNIYNTFLNMKEMFKKQKYIELAKTSPDREICERFLEKEEDVKRIMTARLREFIRDADFVDMIRDSRGFDEVLKTGNGTISETLLYGWGSDESKKKAIRFLLEMYLNGCAVNPETVKAVLKDDHLADRILYGPCAGEKTARQILADHLTKSPEAATTDRRNAKN